MNEFVDTKKRILFLRPQYRKNNLYKQLLTLGFPPEWEFKFPFLWAAFPSSKMKMNDIAFRVVLLASDLHRMNVWVNLSASTSSIIPRQNYLYCIFLMLNKICFYFYTFLLYFLLIEFGAFTYKKMRRISSSQMPYGFAEL